MITWKDDYCIGVEEIDNQHKKLFEIANGIYKLLKNDVYLDKYDRIVSLLDELKDYTVYHFKTEEDYMHGIGYKKLLSHKVQHDDFIEKINDVDYQKVDESQQAYLLELLDFVAAWIVHHIIENDKLITAE